MAECRVAQALLPGCVTVLGEHVGREPIPQGKPGTASQFQRRELVAVPALRRIEARFTQTVKHSPLPAASPLVSRRVSLNTAGTNGKLKRSLRAAGVEWFNGIDLQLTGLGGVEPLQGDEGATDARGRARGQLQAGAEAAAATTQVLGFAFATEDEA